ncbi:DUF2523 family protein [Pseudomonas sp.]|uniref:DUF2523 family protein n=1 Tax=Pseudomonas sp. TaxID=306 RepID=UPI003FD8C0DE
MDLGFIADWFTSANTFFQYVWTFLSSGIFDFVKTVLVFFSKMLIYSFVEFKLFMLDIAYSVVQEIMQETGITLLVTSAWSSIPANVQQTLAFFNIPQGLTLIFSAIPTRWAMKFIPGA